MQQYGLQKQIEAVKGTRTVTKKERDAFCIEFYICALCPFVASCETCMGMSQSLLV